MKGQKGNLEKLIRKTLSESRTDSVSQEEIGPTVEEENEDEILEAKEKKDKDDMDPKKKKAVKEETASAATLHPGAKAVADPAALSSSSVGRLSGIMSVMSSMPVADQVNLFNQVMAQYGPGKTYGVGDNSEQNKSTLDMKPSNAPGGSWDVKMPMPQINAKEDIQVIFDGQELSEEFKEKASVLFEAAVNAKVIAEMAQLEEQYAQQVTEELQVFTEELTDKLDSYLDYVVETWMKDNEVAIESTLRNELMDEFVLGLKNLFTEHYIDIPESKIDVVETLSKKVEELETSLDTIISENTQMKEVIVDVAKKEVFDELSEGLALSQQEKFKTLAEGIEFDGDIETYEKKLKIIKQTYFSEQKNVASTNITEETFEGNITEETVIDPVISRYVQALTRTAKK